MNLTIERVQRRFGDDDKARPDCAGQAELTKRDHCADDADKLNLAHLGKLGEPSRFGSLIAEPEESPLAA